MMRRTFLALAMLALAAAPAAAQDAAAAPADRPVVAAMFFSNFCAACRVLEPRIDHVMPAFEGRPVEFVRLDQTWSLFTREQLDELAAEHGATRIWEQRRGQTGFVALVDPANGDVLDILTIRESTEMIASAIDRALRRPAES